MVLPKQPSKRSEIVVTLPGLNKQLELKDCTVINVKVEFDSGVVTYGTNLDGAEVRNTLQRSNYVLTIDVTELFGAKINDKWKQRVYKSQSPLRV